MIERFFKAFTARVVVEDCAGFFFLGADMTTGEFADLVHNMRAAQKEYFKTRSKEALEKSKILESRVDRLLGERKNREAAKQPTLFDIKPILERA